MARSIPLARPNITQAEIDAVVDVLRTPNLSLGPKVPEFESAFARYCDTAHAVACSSGTAGLHLLIQAMDIGPGDEVITTPFSFVASANCTLMERARPVFVDIDADTWNIDPELIEAAITPKTRAVLAVDVFGQIADMAAVSELARRRGLRVIEDSCEALGSRYRGRPAGSLGDAGVFGFYPNKQITTGEGGMIVTNDDEIARLCHSLRNQGRDEMGTWLEHERLGYNYRLDEMSAALGASQLARIESTLERRAKVAQWYGDALAAASGVRPLGEFEWGKRSWFVYVVVLDEGIPRDEVLKRLEALGVQSRAYFPPIHLQPFYRERFGYEEGAFPVCEGVAARTLTLPFYNQLSRADVQEVVDRLRRALGK